MVEAGVASAVVVVDAVLSVVVSVLSAASPHDTASKTMAAKEIEGRNLDGFMFDDFFELMNKFRAGLEGSKSLNIG